MYRATDYPPTATSISRAQSTPPELLASRVPEPASNCLDGYSFYFLGTPSKLGHEQAKAIVLAYGGEVWDYYRLERSTGDELAESIEAEPYRYVYYAVLGDDVEKHVRDRIEQVKHHQGPRGTCWGVTILDQDKFYKLVLSTLHETPNVAFSGVVNEESDLQPSDAENDEGLAANRDNEEFLQGELHINTTKEDLVKCLKDINHEGQWAVCTQFPHPINPGLRVSDIGLVGLPLSNRDAEALCGASACSSIRPCQFEITNPEFSKVVDGVISHDLPILGINPATVRAVPTSLVLETPNASCSIPYVKQRSDVDAQFVTIAFFLPSKHVGGDIKVEEPKPIIIDTGSISDFGETCLTRYTDTPVKHSSIESGLRLILLMSVELVVPGPRSSVAHLSESRKALSKVLSAWSKDIWDGIECPRYLAYAHSPSQPEHALRTKYLRQVCGPIGAFIWYMVTIKTVIQTTGKKTSFSSTITEIILDSCKYPSNMLIDWDNVLNQTLDIEAMEREHGYAHRDIVTYKCSTTAMIILPDRYYIQFLWNGEKCGLPVLRHLLLRYIVLAEADAYSKPSPARRRITQLSELFTSKPSIYSGGIYGSGYLSEEDKMKAEIVNLLTRGILALGRMDLFARLTLSLGTKWPIEAGRAVSKALPVFGFEKYTQGLEHALARIPKFHVRMRHLHEIKRHALFWEPVDARGLTPTGFFQLWERSYVERVLVRGLNFGRGDSRPLAVFTLKHCSIEWIITHVVPLLRRQMSNTWFVMKVLAKLIKPAKDNVMKTITVAILLLSDDILSHVKDFTEPDSFFYRVLYPLFYYVERAQDDVSKKAAVRDIYAKLLIPFLSLLAIDPGAGHKRQKLDNDEIVDRHERAQHNTVTARESDVSRSLEAVAFMSLMKTAYEHCDRFGFSVSPILQMIDGQLHALTIPSSDVKSIIPSYITTWKSSQQREVDSQLHSKVLGDLLNYYIRKEVIPEPENNDGPIPLEITEKCGRVCIPCAMLDRWAATCNEDEKPLELEPGSPYKKHILSRLIKGYKLQEITSNERRDRGGKYTLIQREDARCYKDVRKWEASFSRTQNWILSHDQASLQSFLGQRYQEITELWAVRSIKTLNPRTLGQLANLQESAAGTPVVLMQASSSISPFVPDYTGPAPPARIAAALPTMRVIAYLNAMSNHVPASFHAAGAATVGGADLASPTSSSSLAPAINHLAAIDSRVMTWIDAQQNSWVVSQPAAPPDAMELLSPPPMSPKCGQKRTADQMDRGNPVIDLSGDD